MSMPLTQCLPSGSFMSTRKRVHCATYGLKDTIAILLLFSTDILFFAGQIVSANWPLSYENSANSEIAAISVPEGYDLLIRVEEFSTETCCDFLTVRSSFVFTRRDP